MFRVKVDIYQSVIERKLTPVQHDQQETEEDSCV